MIRSLEYGVRRADWRTVANRHRLLTERRSKVTRKMCFSRKPALKPMGKSETKANVGRTDFESMRLAFSEN